MRWKWIGSSLEASEGHETSAGRQRIRSDLERRGVSPELSERLCQRVEDRAPQLDPKEYELLLDGVAAAAGAHDESGQEMSQQLRELQDIERLMGGFTKELAKLDEVLEVLAAHVRRMRSNTSSVEGRRLH